MREKQITNAGVSGKKKRNRFKITVSDLQCYSLCAIPFVLILILNYLPMGGLVIAFKDYKYTKGIWGSDWIGFEKFKFLFESSEFMNLLKNTLVLNFSYIIIGTISSVLLAVLLFHVTSRAATKTFQTVLMMPHFVSWVIAAYLVYALLNVNHGFVNQIIVLFGGEKVNWYQEPGAWPVILGLSYLWKSVGYNSIVYYAALMGIDSALFEAAKIDGANRWQLVKKIMVPELKPLLILFTIMNVGTIFRSDFGLFYQIPRNVPALYDATQVIDTYIFRVLREINDMSLGTAVGLLQSVVGFILVLLTNHICERIEKGSGMF